MLPAPENQHARSTGAQSGSADRSRKVGASGSGISWTRGCPRQAAGKAWSWRQRSQLAPLCKVLKTSAVTAAEDRLEEFSRRRLWLVVAEGGGASRTHSSGVGWSGPSLLAKSMAPGAGGGSRELGGGARASRVSGSSPHTLWAWCPGAGKAEAAVTSVPDLQAPLTCPDPGSTGEVRIANFQPQLLPAAKGAERARGEVEFRQLKLRLSQ